MPRRGNRLTRSLTKPFVDLSNYLRPHMHAERGITAEAAHALALERTKSGGIGSSTLVDLPETREDPLTPAPDTPITPSTSASSSLGDAFPTPPDEAATPPFPFESRQWKECTPILEEDDEMDTERTFSRLPSAAISEEPEEEEEEEEVDDSFATADHSSDVFESPEVCRTRSHTWHALSLPNDSDFDLSTPRLQDSPRLQPFLLDDEEEGEASSINRTPSLVDEDEFPFDGASPRDSEDSYAGPSTPNTTIPFSSPARELDWSPTPLDRDIKGKGRAVPVAFPTSTPPRSAFVEVIETCPTPEHPSQDAEPSRKRSLMTSGLGIAFEEDDAVDHGQPEEEQPAEGPTSALSSHSLSVRSLRRSLALRDDLSSFSRSNDSLPLQHERVHVVEASMESLLSPSIYPDAAHFDTYTRRPSGARPALYQPDAPDALSFPAVDPAQLVHSLLAQQSGLSPSTEHLPNLDAPYPDIPSPPRHLRPLSPHASPAFASSAFSPSHDRRPSSRSRRRRSEDRPRTAPSPTPFSSLVPLDASLPPQSRVPVLKGRASASTLCAYDLAHLPAPDTPRERPYRVRPMSLVLPTAMLGGGKGSGLYGDVCGAIERRVPDGKGKGKGKEEKRRSLSMKSLSGLVRSASMGGGGAGDRQGQRRSLFGLSSLGACGAIVERPSLEELGSAADEGAEDVNAGVDASRPSTSFSHFGYGHHSTAPADDPTLSIDEFGILAPADAAPSAPATLRKRPRALQRPNTAPGLGRRASLPAAPASPASPTKRPVSSLRRGSSLRRSLNRLSFVGNGSEDAREREGETSRARELRERAEDERARDRRQERDRRRSTGSMWELLRRGPVEELTDEELSQWVAVTVR